MESVLFVKKLAKSISFYEQTKLSSNKNSMVTRLVLYTKINVFMKICDGVVCLVIIYNIDQFFLITTIKLTRESILSDFRCFTAFRFSNEELELTLH